MVDRDDDRVRPRWHAVGVHFRRRRNERDPILALRRRRDSGSRRRSHVRRRRHVAESAQPLRVLSQNSQAAHARKQHHQEHRDQDPNAKGRWCPRSRGSRGSPRWVVRNVSRCFTADDSDNRDRPRIERRRGPSDVENRVGLPSRPNEARSPEFGRVRDARHCREIPTIAVPICPLLPALVVHGTTPARSSVLRRGPRVRAGATAVAGSRGACEALERVTSTSPEEGTFARQYGAMDQPATPHGGGDKGRRVWGRRTRVYAARTCSSATFGTGSRSRMSWRRWW